jgi:hypothetical protein
MIINGVAIQDLREASVNKTFHVEHRQVWHMGTSRLTASLMENAFVHLTSVPEATERCFTGNENVNPISRFLPFEMLAHFSSSSTNLANSEAMKPKSS